jgi:hypothetical protein
MDASAPRGREIFSNGMSSQRLTVGWAAAYWSIVHKSQRRVLFFMFFYYFKSEFRFFFKNEFIRLVSRGQRGGKKGPFCPLDDSSRSKSIILT